MNEILIRTATEDDLDALCGLFIEANRVHHTGEPSIFEAIDDAPWLRERLLFCITGEDASILIADSGRRAVGFVQSVVISTRDVPVLVQKRFATVENLVVTEAFRGRGIGRALMNAAHEWAIGMGMDEIELTVWEFNDGTRALYESLGYQTANRKMRVRLR